MSTTRKRSKTARRLEKELPEPGKSVQGSVENELLQGGRSRPSARRQARAQAEEWLASSRATQTASRSPGRGRNRPPGRTERQGHRSTSATERWTISKRTRPKNA